ncbi:beta-galactosidase [Sphingomonas sp. DG1-23]|uniref:beta-galactosidase n=1 Tax=Sphingomonas sp. DG1-23 TaxID=3068316 RepID=UPI00273DB136|nr:beta-galactosidase [Sphingomonas sp. DG1-23]MDP5279790.1 beta-galactosidase [Sphingomonas sp. DG1-23]
MRRSLTTLAAALGVIVAAIAPAHAQSRVWHARATQFENRPALAFGVAWYPEQWPEARWQTDLQLMRSAGFNTVRLAEFAWSTMEPEEGRFDFGWLDRAIDAAVRNGMMVVLGTPSAAPPAWLTQKYPDTLRVDEDGKRAGHGGRRHFSFASARYRQFATRIAAEMATRYGKNPAIVGWQIDNEIGPPSWDPESVAAWHHFLEQRYGTIDELNRRWATQYWSQHYNNFDQVPLRATGQHNPGLLLDFKHFTTATWTDYVAAQAAAIRAHADPRQFVTTNTMFWNAGFDHFALHRVVDMASWDNYIPDGRPDWVANGANHDLVRGYKQRNFWLMETQPGRVDWVPVNRALDPGQVREMAWQAVGHGADALLYWQWRPARNGQETYHGALLGADGTPVPVFGEVARTGKEFAQAAPLLADTEPAAQIAMLFSYDSRWAIDIQRHHKDFDPVRQFLSLYRPLRTRTQGIHVIAPDAELGKYRLVVAPSLHVLTPPQAERLVAYVRAGGHLVLGPRSGMKDDANALWPKRQPGPLADLLGAEVEQYYALDAPVGVQGSYGAGKANIWAEAIRPVAKDVEVLATYSDPHGWLDGKPAAVTRRVGKGRITYIGGWLDDGLLATIATQLLDGAGIRPVLADLHPDIEVGERSGAGKRLLILINHGAEPHPIALPAGASLVTGDLAGGTLSAHGVALIKLR